MKLFIQLILIISIVVCISNVYGQSNNVQFVVQSSYGSYDDKCTGPVIAVQSILTGKCDRSNQISVCNDDGTITISYFTGPTGDDCRPVRYTNNVTIPSNTCLEGNVNYRCEDTFEILDNSYSMIYLNNCPTDGSEGGVPDKSNVYTITSFPIAECVEGQDGSLFYSYCTSKSVFYSNYVSWNCKGENYSNLKYFDTCVDHDPAMQYCNSN